MVPPDANEVRALLSVVQSSFNDAERQLENRYGHPIKRRAREGVAPTIEAAYAYGDTPRVYYIEATRAYRELGQPSGECSSIGLGTGWLIRDASGVRALTMVVDLLNCDRRSASYMLPLGVLRLDHRTYWLAQFRVGSRTIRRAGSEDEDRRGDRQPVGRGLLNLEFGMRNAECGMRRAECA